MKKMFFALIGCFVAICAHAAQIVNVDYIHKLIQQEWDVTVPIRTDNVMAAANMKYLLTAIDVANQILNGEKTTDYGNGEFATTQAVDTIATNQAVETLIKKEIEYEFFLTTTSTNSFSFSISAAGEFVVDWGDGKTEPITKPDTTNTTYSHNYSTAGAYTIGLSGQATAYNTDEYTAAISFVDSVDWEFESTWQIASIDGSLGAIFGTLPDATEKQPRFCYTFSDAYNMGGTIPENLFAGISGAPASNMFYNTFFGCSGLTGAIPAGLFAGISGAPASNMFSNTFYGCSGLTGAIPAGLFGNLSGAPAYGMFNNTFHGCSGLTSIPENLFGNISGPEQDEMFFSTFYNCTSLTGPSARINGQYLYEIWPRPWYAVDNMYYNATGLSDYLYIPVTWGGLGATTNEYPSAPSDAVYDFYLTTTSDTDVFAMQISAAGEFYIDWGDGKSEWITKSDATNMTFGHKYTSKGVYNIRLGGQATAYNTDLYTAAISFFVNPSQRKIASIDGSLGAIFRTLSSNTNNQPKFYQTFSQASNMKGAIPANLFAGISGAPAEDMFSSTFSGCSGLTSIPAGLFAGISGAPAESMFDGTFEYCSGLTSIPDGLFAGISGAPAREMFAFTFYNCSGLTSIPAGLFAGISGAPAYSMFYNTFYGCSKLTSIPENLFGNISGKAQSNMFSNTFSYCTSLTGPSARINGQYLYEIWPSATTSQVNDMYYNATKLSDYSSIPSAWK